MRRILLVFLGLLVIAVCISTAQATTQNLTVGVVANCPPYQFLDEKGDCCGLHIDILNEIAAQQNLLLEYMEFQTGTECNRALEDGQIDMILGVALSGQSDLEWVTDEGAERNIGRIDHYDYP